VESCTALVEHWDGTWEIVTWTQEKDNVADDINSSTPERSNGPTGESGTTISGSKDLPASIVDNEVAIKV
jgi:hypothetical protein